MDRKRDRTPQGFSLLIGLVVIGAALATLAALMTRVDQQTLRITTLKRGVQALAVANEQLELLRRAYQSSGAPPATAKLERSFGSAEAQVGPASPAARAYLATVRGNCEGSGALVIATLRREGGRVVVENKRVGYGVAATATEEARKAMFDRLQEAYRKLRTSFGDEADLKRQGKLAGAYEPALRASGLDADELGDVLAELRR